MINGFLLGVIATCSLVAGIFFLRFWRDTRDSLFLAFAVAFLVEAANRTAMLLLNQPNEGKLWIYLVRFLAFMLIVAGIVSKNRKRPDSISTGYPPPGEKVPAKSQGQVTVRRVGGAG